MKIVLFLLAFTAYSTNLLAQVTSSKWKVGAEAGVSCSILDTDVSGLSKVSYKVRPGFTAAIGAEYNVVDNLAVAAGIHFIQRDYFYQNTGGYIGNIRHNNNFVGIPVTVGYYLLHNPYCEKGLWLKPQVGVFYEYFTFMKTKGTYPMSIMEGYKGDGSYIKYNSTYDFSTNENHLRRSLLGGELGIKVGYSFGRIDANVGYNFQYGFSHIYQEKSHTSKTARRNSSVITAGIAYKL